MRRVLFGLLVLAAAAAGLIIAGGQGWGPVVVTNEDEQKIVLLLGAPRDEALGPGLSFRWPLLEEVRTFDRRWLHLSAEPVPIQTEDRERIVVDNYVIWRIADPLLYYESYPTGRMEAETQIDREVRAKVREVIGQRTLSEVVTGARPEIMTEITRESHAALESSGVRVKDVRINRTDLPSGTLDNVYARMRAERNRLARKHRAEGEEEARRLRAEADRRARVIVAEAQEQAAATRAGGDARATGIYAEAHSRNPGFYKFLRSLEAYRATLDAETTLILPPSHDFFRLLGTGEIEGEGAGTGPGESGGGASGGAAD